MPELPEVETVVRTLAPHLRGRRIVAASFSSRFVTPGNRKTLARRLADRTIQSIQRRGKFIVIQLDQGTLTVHLGMTGRLLLDAAPTKHTYGIFTLDTGSLIYTDPRQFGRILWNHDLSRLGPEPLAIGLGEFQARMKLRKTGIKALLLNQTFLAGMGNIYVDETLFAARVHPLAQASRLSAASRRCHSSAYARDPGRGHQTRRIVDFRLRRCARRARLVSTAASGLRARRRAVRRMRDAHPQDYRGPTRDTLLPAVPTTVAAVSKRALAISSATSTTAFIAFTSCTRTR